MNPFHFLQHIHCLIERYLHGKGNEESKEQCLAIRIIYDNSRLIFADIVEEGHHEVSKDWINKDQCSKSGSGKGVGQVTIFRGEQPVNNQQSLEAEDDQHTQVCELEIEIISSTVFILWGSAGASSCLKSGAWYW